MAKAEDADRKDNKRSLAARDAPRKYFLDRICSWFCSACIECFHVDAQPVFTVLHN